MNVSAIGKCNNNMPIVVLEHNPVGTKKIIEYSNQHNRFVNLILSGNFFYKLYFSLLFRSYSCRSILYNSTICFFYITIFLWGI